MADWPGIPVELVPRDEILEPVAAVGVGPAATALARRVVAHDDARLCAWTGVAGPNVLVVIGPTGTLPWVDGATYLGRDPRAPRLFVPTNLQPSSVAMEIFEAAVFRRAPGLAAPLAVVPAPPLIFSLANALPIARGPVRSWLEANS